MEKIREHFTFYGRVQGVGFRYKMKYAAAQYKVTGRVSNEYDGTVTAELQGYDYEIDKVLQYLVKDAYIRIDRMERRKIAIKENETGFSVRG